MPIEPTSLPYSRAALEPHLSARSVEHHHAHLQRDWLGELNALTHGGPWAGLALDELVRRGQGRVFELAAQLWNHDFYWHGLRSRSGGEPGGALGEAIVRAFGDMAGLRAEFLRQAQALNSAGWLWLVQRPDRRLAVLTTLGANTPLTGTDAPLLACDLWEHAYWPDYQDSREAYLDAFWKLVNWECVASRMST